MSRYPAPPGMRTLALLLLVLLHAPPAAARQVDAERLQGSLQAAFDSLFATSSIPGATLGVRLPDGTTLALAVGVSDRGSGRAMRPHDRMLAGSVGKTFFAAVVLQLVAEGRFDLDRPLRAYLGDEPWYNRLPNADGITPRMLMKHTSGIVRYEFDERFTADLSADPARVWRPEELVAYILGTDPPFAAGQGWTYSDTNYILLCMAVEKVTGRPMYDEIRRRVLEPLALRDTVPSDSRTIPGLIQGYAGPGNPFGGTDAMLSDGVFAINPQFEWAGGGFASSSPDLARWASDYFEGRAWDISLLPQVTDGVPARQLGRGARYGLAAILSETRNGTAWGHSGFFPGYLTEMRYYPEHRFSIAFQVNTSVGRALGRPQGAWLDTFAAIVIRSLAEAR